MNRKLHLLSLGLVSALALSSCNSENNQSQQQAQAPAAPSQEQAHSAAAPHATQQAPAQVMTAKEPSAFIPDFTFYKVKSGISFTKADINSKKNSVFLLFDPNCGHCQQEAGMLAKNIQKLKNVNLYFVSMNDPALMVTFFDTFGKALNDQENVEMLYDRNQDFIQKIHVPNQFPANYVYGPDGQLKTYWEGEKSEDFILSAISK